MNTAADQSVRDLALDAQQSFIVQAPAGSGKTELLTRRVLTLLCTVDEPEEILAITFTRKAASEMRQRVIEALTDAASQEAPSDPYKLEGWTLARQVLARDEQLRWQMIRNPQRLNLRTIDGLATRLAHRLPVTSTLGAPTSPVDKADALYKQAAQRFIESHLDSLDLVLLHLGNKLEKAQSLLAGLLAKRDQWKRHVYAAGDDHHQLRSILEGMLAELVESRVENLCSLQPDNLEDRLLPCLVKAAEFALLDVEGDIDELGWEMQLWHSMDSLPGAQADDLNGWASVAHALLTANNGVRARLTRNEGFPTSKANAKNIGVDVAVLKAHKQNMVDILDAVQQSPDFIEALIEVRKLPAPVYKDEQWALLSQLLNVLPDLLIELQLVFAEAAQVDFSELSARAALALGSEDEPTDLALSMDLSLKHLLVDEFQDTSQTQFSLFEKLLSAWEPGDGRTFFAVGDPMQSIYRFREGDVALFTQVQTHGIGPVQVTPLTLSVNFRAAPAVTQWVNQTFSSIFPKQADADSGAIPYSASQAFKTGLGSVTVHPLIDTDKQTEAAHVAELCKTATENDPEHTVAILVRSRVQATHIFAALREHALAYESVEMDLVGERMVVRDLVTLVLALRYPHDRLHWLSLLRAPFVGLGLHDLHALMGDADTPVALIERLQDEAVVAGMDAEARQRIARFMAVIEPAMQRTMRSRLMPWVESVWLQLGGPVVCEHDSDVNAAERAMALLYQLEERGELWSKATIEAAMAGLYAVAPDAQHCQIQVMTLHKSKGLEFDSVILPALDRRSRVDGTQLLNWFESTLDGKPQLLLAPFEQAGLHSNQRDRLIKLVQRAEERCNAQEKLRLLYVACTRAKSHLHLVACAAHNVKGELAKPVAASLLSPLWPVLETEFTAASDAVAPDDVTPSTDSVALPKPPMYARLPVDAEIPVFNRFHWQNRPVTATDSKSLEIEYQWAGRDARDIGTVIHDQLHMMADQPDDIVPENEADRVEVIRRQLKNLGMGASRLDRAVEKVSRALNNTRDDKRGRWILQEHAQSRCEWALSVPTAALVHDNSVTAEPPRFGPVQKVIIDRTFVDQAGVRWIVDYKTGDHEGGNLNAFLDEEQKRYADQLNRYADIMKRMEDRPVRVGLYFPMLKQWREWEPE